MYFFQKTYSSDKLPSHFLSAFDRYAQASVKICPSIHGQSAAGTYAVTVRTVTGSVFYVDASVNGFNTYPLARSPTASNCSSVPASDYTVAGQGGSLEPLCLEEGITTSMTTERAVIGRLREFFSCPLPPFHFLLPCSSSFFFCV